MTDRDISQPEQTEPVVAAKKPDASLFVWSSPSTKGAGAFQLWENYWRPLSAAVEQVTIYRGHSESDTAANPQVKLNLRSALWALTKLRMTLKKRRTTHVVTSISQSDIIFGLILRPFINVHWTIYVLGQPYPVEGQTGRLKSVLWKKLWLFSARKANRIVAVSDYIGRIIADELEGCAIGTAYPSIVNAEENYRRSRTHSPGNIHVGFVGRLSHEKDPLLFCDIVNELDWVTSKIFGDGPLSTETKVRGEAIEQLGFRPQHEIYGSIDVLLMTSRSEGLPMVLVEASFAGIVPLVADVGGCVEAIHPDNRDVLVIPRHERENIFTWRERLLILANPERRDLLRKRQLEWARSNFDFANNSKILVDFLIPERQLH